jgi:chromosome segregation ATPase
MYVFKSIKLALKLLLCTEKTRNSHAVSIQLISKVSKTDDHLKAADVKIHSLEHTMAKLRKEKQAAEQLAEERGEQLDKANEKVRVLEQELGRQPSSPVGYRNPAWATPRKNTVRYKIRKMLFKSFS